jgi:hypothetical protein
MSSNPNDPNDPASYPSGTELRVCRMIAERQMIGTRKYGTTVAANPLPLRAWLQHALEESLDHAIYLKRAIEELDKQQEVGQ